MRVGVVTTQAPFIIGGAERHSANLVAALRERGHEATEISIPYKWYPGQALVDHVLAAKLIDLSDLGYPVDLMVGLKFPAWLARHPAKVFWILHQHRQAYDLWESGMSELQRDPDGAAVRELIRAEDRAAIGAPGARVYANSRNVAARLERFLGIPSTPLYHPPPNAPLLRAGEYGDFLFAPSRLGPNKRQALMIEALAHAPGVRLRIAGPPDAPGYDETLRALARERGVEDRVEILGPIDDATMIRLYATCRAVVFVPIDEDYGYITLEAMLSARPVITVTDAGGPLEFIADGAQGLVCAPEPAALGAAFVRMAGDRAGAEAMGAAARAAYDAQGIGWDRVVEVLTGVSLPHAAPAPSAPADTVRAPAAPAPDLAAAMDPPQPEALPFDSLDALLGAYEFGTYPGAWQAEAPQHAPYFATHWQRYRATLALLEGLAPQTILDIGIVPPFLFQGLLAAAFPDARIEGLWSDPRPYEQTVRALHAPARDFALRLHPGNAERDALPLPDASVDLVLAMEILEHLAVDPTHLLAQAARVLRPGGHLLITTPNAASHRAVTKALAGQAPQSFGLFVPVGGVHGRHNREYAPAEVQSLAEAAGFATLRLLTADVYDRRIDLATAALLADRGEDGRLRGETILWLGRRTGTPGPTPPGLFHGEPARHAGRLIAAARAADGALTLRILNRSRADWPVEGDLAVGLCLDWQDPRGRLVHQGAWRGLPAPVPAGGETAVTLPLGDPAAARGTLSVGLFERGAGRLAGTGRADPLSLPCSEAVFLALVGAG